MKTPVFCLIFLICIVAAIKPIIYLTNTAKRFQRQPIKKFTAAINVKSSARNLQSATDQNLQIHAMMAAGFKKIICVQTSMIQAGVGLLPKIYRAIRGRLTEKNLWKLFLLNELKRLDFTLTDFEIMEAIIECESRWEHFRNGKVKVSLGNVGLAQINKSANARYLKKYNFDINDPYQNLSYAVWLYHKNSWWPWKPWSGRCWLKKIGKKKPTRPQKSYVFSKDFWS